MNVKEMNTENVMTYYQCCGVGVEAGVGVGLNRQFWLGSES